MKIIMIILSVQLLAVFSSMGQTDPSDSLTTVNLDEVIVMVKPVVNYTKQSKPLSSLDEYLERCSMVSMVKRGNYAWDPMLNNMASERISVTIDGMHLFGACTDKMDPLTSYVDVSGLSEITISSGQQGTSNGPTIGGAIDLARTRHNFCNPGWSGSVDLGIETNARLLTSGLKLKYAHHLFFIDVAYSYRDAENYKAGKRILVPFSQFTKYNLSVSTGVRLNQKNKLIASLIYDKAKDVGYPALPMDVSRAQAIITSLQHTAEGVNAFIEEWDTKVYYNTVLHEMDDTKRPAVPVHMDMPGWSSTYGGYSKLKATSGNHDIRINLNVYYNRSKAEMTMYPKDIRENSMFMYTWPDVRTTYAGLNIEDKVTWRQRHSLRYSASSGFHRNNIASDFGFNSLRIFYPGMKSYKNRILNSAQAEYTYQKNGLEVSAGIGYGERASSVSEGYGFYLFNSFDRYDYVGNPYLKNEKSIELNGAFSYKAEKFKAELSVNYFHILDYIIGIYNPALLPMTIGASGVREYKALSAADISNVELKLDYRPHPSWKAKAVFMYSYGKDMHHVNLPLIKPFSFRLDLTYRIKSFDIGLAIEGASKQYSFSSAYGEDKTPGYAILNLSAGYAFSLKDSRLFLRAGLENIADTYYSTFSDWNNIPRKGRNFYINASFTFDKRKKE